MLENATQTTETAQFIGGGLFTLILLVAIITWLLNIILFFKIWGMTNDVSQMKEVLKEWLDLEHPEEDEASEDDIAKIKAE